MRPDNEQMRTLGLPDNNECKLTQRDSASWTVTAQDGTDLGVVVSTAPYARHIKGFAGTTPLYLYINTQGHISQIAAAENAETPDFSNAPLKAQPLNGRGNLWPMRHTPMLMP